MLIFKPKLKRTLKAIWDNADNARARYVPRANSIGKHTWDVWDRQDQRFVTDRKEVLALDTAEILVRYRSATP